MGNYTSRTYKAIKISAYTHTKSSQSASRVIFPGGEIHQYREPINAAELMLDFPNLFLVNFRSIKAGQRFQPLRADQYLEPANIYVFFPMKRVHSVVTAGDAANISFMLSLSKRATANINNVFKVTPEIESGGPRLSLEGVEGFPMPEFKKGAGIFMCRSKKPTLDTIRE